MQKKLIRQTSTRPEHYPAPTMASASSATTATSGLASVTDPVTIVTTLNGFIHYLSGKSEINLETASLSVYKRENDKVLADFPHGKYGAEVVIIVSTGSTSTQLSDYYSGLPIGSVAGGVKNWGPEAQAEFVRLVATRSTPLPGTPNASTPWTGRWRPTSLVVVGACGYKVEGPQKWHAPGTVPTPLTQFLAEYQVENPEFAVAVLNRTKAAAIKQINCDWGAAFSSLPMDRVRDAWPQAPPRPEGTITVDHGGGYPRAYGPDGRKIKVFGDYHPPEKANDFLFPDDEFDHHRLSERIEQIQQAVNRMLREHPEHATGQVTPLTIIATGKLRDHYFETVASK